MAINKKLIHFSKQESFDNEVANNNILDTSICFIKDSKSISTHGTIYPTVNWSILDPTNGYEYIDLGLPSGLKLATCNIGASSPEDYGDYFAWGETSPKAEYTEENNVTNGQQINDFSGDVQYDAATANWGGSWRMPTRAELQELIDECTWTWTTQGGNNGYKVTGPNGNSIFLPPAVYRLGSSLNNAGSYGSYWSSTPSSSSNAFSLLFDSSSHRVHYGTRYYGFTVRPVINI